VDVLAAVIMRLERKRRRFELREYCRTKLSAFEDPASIYIVADFPRTAKGYTERRALAAQFTGAEAR